MQAEKPVYFVHARAHSFVSLVAHCNDIGVDRSISCVRGVAHRDGPLQEGADLHAVAPPRECHEYHWGSRCGVMNGEGPARTPPSLLSPPTPRMIAPCNAPPSRAFLLQSCAKSYIDSGEKVWEACGEMGKGLEGPKSHDRQFCSFSRFLALLGHPLITPERVRE